MKNYFTLDEDFKTIIEKALSENYKNIELKKITPNSTGWTNIVFEAQTNQGNFFFRFPRDHFWEKTIVKDYEFAKFIKGKTSFKTVDLNLMENNGRFFSMHKKIDGTPLAEKMNSLSQEEVKKISSQIANFMYQIHNLEYNENEIFTINNIGLELHDFIDELLNVHVSSEDQLFWNTQNFKLENKNESCLVHGDFNSSNVLIDTDNNVCAIIDFGFGGFGNKYFDISRIIGRCPENFKNEIISSYEALEKNNLNSIEVDKNIDTWNKIDSSYINYMRTIGIYE